MTTFFEENDSTEGVLLVDASNALNSLNRGVMLRNIQELCPAFSKWVTNFYRSSTFLFVGGETIQSLEGTTQGDSLSMAIYALATLPLINLAKLSTGNATQCWIADDAGAGGKLQYLFNWWCVLAEKGPLYGYFVNPPKTCLVVKDCHRQQCNATTYMLLTAFCCKNFAITIFTWGSLWVEMLFFLLLFDRSCRFPRCSNSKLSLSIPSVVQSKKVGRDMNTHLRRRSYSPRQTAPLGPSHFLSKTFSRPTLEVNRSSPKIADQDAHQGIASQYIWVSKNTKNSLQASCSGPLRAAKKQKNQQDFHADGPAASKDTFFFDFGGRLLDCWCSSSLALFSFAIYSCLGDLATCFTCLHRSKQAKKPTWCANHGAGLQTHMQPVLHAAHASLHHLHAQ